MATPVGSHPAGHPSIHPSITASLHATSGSYRCALTLPIPDAPPRRALRPLKGARLLAAGPQSRIYRNRPFRKPHENAPVSLVLGATPTDVRHRGGAEPPPVNQWQNQRWLLKCLSFKRFSPAHFLFFFFLKKKHLKW